MAVVISVLVFHVVDVCTGRLCVDHRAVFVLVSEQFDVCVVCSSAARRVFDCRSEGSGR